MKKILGLLLAAAAAVCLAPIATAQTPPVGWVQVSASNSRDAGVLIVNGTVSFYPVSSTGAAISFRVGSSSGGIVGPDPWTTTVANGVWSIQVPDVSLTTPVNPCYNVVIVDNVTGNTLSGPGLTCVQPYTAAGSGAGWSTACSAASGSVGGSCNFDAYTPNQPAQTTVQTGPPGPGLVPVGAYSSGATYTAGNLVSYGGNNYACITACSGVTPTAGVNWELIQGGGLDQLTGDVLAGPGTGSQAAAVVKINGAAVPPSASVLGSNSSGQPVAASTTGSGAVVLAVSPALTGTPTAPTQTGCGNNTDIATEGYVAFCANAGFIVPTQGYNASGLATATTGGCSSSSSPTSLTIASATGWLPNEGIDVAGAGTAGADLITSVSAIAGTTFTLATSCLTTVSGAAVNHDDTAALQAAWNASIAGGGAVHLLPGTYNITSALTESSPGLVMHGDGWTNAVIQNRGTTNDVIYIDYSVPVHTLTSTNGTELDGFSVQQASGITATAGSALHIGVNSASALTIGVLLKNISVLNTCGGLYVQGGQISNWFEDMYIVHTECSRSVVGGGGIYYTMAPWSGGPGDDHFNDIETTDAGTGSQNTGVTIVSSDTTEFSHIKINSNAGLVFTGGGVVVRPRFDDVSIEGNGGSSAVTFPSSGSGTQQATFNGGETEGFTHAFVEGSSSYGIGTALPGNSWCATNFINADDPTAYGGQMVNYCGGTQGGASQLSYVGSNAPSCSPVVLFMLNDGSCTTAAAYQARDVFQGATGTVITSHTANTGQSWTAWNVHAGDCAAGTFMSLTGYAQVTDTCSSANVRAYIGLTPATANYTSCLTANASGIVAVMGRMSTGVETLYEVILASSQLQLYVASAGSYTQLGSNYPYTWIGNHTLCLAMNGTSISASIDGVTPGALTATDATIVTAGVTGIVLGQNTQGGQFTVQ